MKQALDMEWMNIVFWKLVLYRVGRKHTQLNSDPFHYYPKGIAGGKRLLELS
jgi:hypothetical protein